MNCAINFYLSPADVGVGGGCDPALAGLFRCFHLLIFFS